MDADMLAEVLLYKFAYKAENGVVPRLNFDEVKKIMDCQTFSAIEGIAKDAFLIA